MKKNKKFLKFLISLYQPVKLLSFVMIISMIISQVFDLLKNYIIKDIIDLPNNPNFQITDLYKISAFLILTILLVFTFRYISNIIRNITIVKKQTPHISEYLFSNLSKKNYAFFVDNFSGKISSAINQVSNEIIDLNARITVGFVSLLTSMISSLIILFTINIPIFIIALILFAGIIITRSLYFTKKYLPLIKTSQEYNIEYSGILNDAVLNFTSLKVYSAVDNFSHTLKKKREEANIYRNEASKREFTYGAIANLIYLIVFAILLVYAIKLYSNNLMSLGNFVFFINAMVSLKASSTDFTWSYIKIGEILVRLKNSYELLYEDYNYDDEYKDEIVVNKGQINFDNVNFKYTNNYVLKNFNLEIKDQEKVGIIGVSGSGKTTLVNLLFKFYNPESGRILIDGQDIADCSTKSVYKVLTYVPQETILMHASILDNIKIAKMDASYDEIVKACKRAELHDFIETLPQKYETIVGERGIKLSGGQRQRIALARIFLKDAKIVIFDEATSSLDNNTEFKIQQNINKYFKKETIICIAHRLSTLKEMDYIVVMDNGYIIDVGTPKEIIPKYDKVDFKSET